MLTKNYIQIEFEKYKLKYYIDRRECDNIFKFMYQDCYNNTDYNELFIHNSLGALNYDVIVKDIYLIINEKVFYDSALLFFNNRLYKILELCIDCSDILDRKLEDITELYLLNDKDIRKIGTLDVLIYPPIYRI